MHKLNIKGGIKDLNEVIWKDIPEFNGLYKISNTGEIKSIDGCAIRTKHKGRILRQNTSHKGYRVITIKVGNNKKTYPVHRIVAKSFVKNPRPDIYDQVNHIDGVKSNNNAQNLEWCNNSLNQIHANRMGLNANRIKKSNEGSRKPLAQYSIDGNLIGIYESARKAELETGVPYKSISLCCCGGTHTAYGFIWEFIPKAKNISE